MAEIKKDKINETVEKQGAMYVVICSFNRDIYVLENPETKNNLFYNKEDAHDAMLDDMITTYKYALDDDITIEELKKLLENKYINDIDDIVTIDCNNDNELVVGGMYPDSAWINFKNGSTDFYDVCIVKVKD